MAKVEGKELKKRGSQLKHVTTKEFDGPLAEDVLAIAKVYEEQQGSIELLAARFDISKEILRDSPPEDAEAFARNLLEGLYLVDKDANVLANFRRRLQVELKRSTSKLKPSTTKELVGPLEADIDAAAQIFKQHCGDLESIAKHCGISWEVLVERPPTDANDFGKNLLEGHYSIDKSEAAKRQLREKLREKVVEVASGLKKTVTKESSSAPTEQQVAALAKIWDEKKSVGDLAQKLGLAESILTDTPPASSEDFAKKAFSGAYTQVETEVAKAEFRAHLAEQVADGMSKLKSTATSRPRSNTEEDLAGFAKFYTDKDGNLKAIAAATGIEVAILVRNPPKDSGDFAEKLLNGTYSADQGEQAKMQFRYRMRTELGLIRPRLRSASTKVWDGKASEEDIKLFAKIYRDKDGNLEEIANTHSLDLAMLLERRPVSPEDFAEKLLMGDYTPEYVAVAKRAMRAELVRNIKENHMPRLRHTETKTFSGEPQPGEIALVAKVFNEHKGDLKKLAVLFSADQQSVMEAQPKDANDFAVKLLSGAFAHAEQEDLRGKLRDILGGGLQGPRRPSLRAASTKEALGEPKEEDIASIAKKFDEHAGSLPKIAAELTCDLALLTKDAPTDGRKFAAKYLAGHYRA